MTVVTALKRTGLARNEEEDRSLEHRLTGVASNEVDVGVK
jgi:hypothetical protein